MRCYVQLVNLCTNLCYINKIEQINKTTEEKEEADGAQSFNKKLTNCTRG